MRHVDEDRKWARAWVIVAAVVGYYILYYVYPLFAVSLCLTKGRETLSNIAAEKRRHHHHQFYHFILVFFLFFCSCFFQNWAWLGSALFKSVILHKNGEEAKTTIMIQVWTLAYACRRLWMDVEGSVLMFTFIMNERTIRRVISSSPFE